ncbi:hypothetical protein, partial [Azospirillum baldaniorum]|uniref:hypothetical protein n=1 Tax=Azospirillum baldaniorum TaxID=1064539 RepID=UPI001B3BE1C2
MTKGGLANDVATAESAARLFVDWPKSLYAWLDRNGRNMDGQVGLQAEFGHVLPRLRAVFDEESFSFLYSAARQYFADHWNHGIVKRRSVFYVAPDSPRYISGASAAEALALQLRWIGLPPVEQALGGCHVRCRGRGPAGVVVRRATWSQ